MKKFNLIKFIEKGLVLYGMNEQYTSASPNGNETIRELHGHIPQPTNQIPAYDGGH